MLGTFVMCVKGRGLFLLCFVSRSMMSPNLNQGSMDSMMKSFFFSKLRLYSGYCVLFKLPRNRATIDTRVGGFGPRLTRAPPRGCRPNGSFTHRPSGPGPATTRHLRFDMYKKLSLLSLRVLDCLPYKY